MAKPTLQEVIDAVEADDNSGFCMSCGEQAFGVEPDARKCHCDSCGEDDVYGAEECLMILGMAF